MAAKRADTPTIMPQLSDQELLSARARIPQHVVHRSFVAETVVLNLSTGQYHGLNPTAGEMLKALEAAPTVGAAVPEIAGEYGQEQEQVQGDLLVLIRGLIERGLIEAVNDDAD